MPKEIIVNNVKFEIRDDGFLWQSALEKTVILDFKYALKEKEALLELCDGVPHKMVMDGRGVNAEISNEYRVFMANDKEIAAIRKAEAHIIGSAVQRILSNFYLLINKPIGGPIKAFENEEAALEWLRAIK